MLRRLTVLEFWLFGKNKVKSSVENAIIKMCNSDISRGKEVSEIKQYHAKTKYIY
jgi:hypothetical protein